jgi:hypothetical protein
MQVEQKCGVPLMLNPEAALSAVRDCMNARSYEYPRLDRIDIAVKPLPAGTIRVQIPAGAPLALTDAARRSEPGLLQLALNTYSQILKLDGLYQPSAPDRAPGWKHWQRNQMDARQAGIHQAALKYGAAYATVLPGDPSPIIRGYTPRRMTALFHDPAEDEFPVIALDVNGQMMRLFDATHVYYVGSQNPLLPPLAPEWANLQASNFYFLRSEEHGMGVCPVVRYRDQMLLGGEEQYGIVEPLIDLEDRVRETNFETLVAQYFQAFRQRYIVGWEAKDEAEKLKASAASLWTFEDKDVQVGSMPQTDLTPLESIKQSHVRDFAAAGQLSASAMGVHGVDKMNPEAVAAAEASQDRRASEIQTTLGEAHEQMFRLCGIAANDAASADDYDSEVRWHDFTTVSYAQKVDGLTKIFTMLGIPEEMAWEEIPDWTDNKVARAKLLISQGSRTASQGNIAAGAQSAPASSAPALPQSALPLKGTVN